MNELPLAKVLPGVSAISYGCMGLGGAWNDKNVTDDSRTQAHAIVDAALEVGINFFDHADIYTLGKAETVFGEILKERKLLRDEIYIQSKCGIRFEDSLGPKRYDFSAEWILSSVESSLRRLNTEYLDVYLLHRPDPLMDPEVVAEVFNRLLSAGKVKHFGVSNMASHQIAFLQSHLDMPLVVNQLEISLSKLDWLEEGVYAGHPAGHQYNFGPGILEYCRANKVQIQSWGTMSQGLFTGKDLNSKPKNIRDTAKKVKFFAEKYDVAPEAIVLAWLMRHPAKIQTIVGSSKPERILACRGAEKVSMTREDWYELYILARGSELP